MYTDFACSPIPREYENEIRPPESLLSFNDYITNFNLGTKIMRVLTTKVLVTEFANRFSIKNFFQ